MKRLLEIAAFNTASAAIAAAAGADRIELCSGQSEGGTTPDPGMIRAARQLKVPFFVMIRPRGGDFSYTPGELLQMEQSLLEAKALGADGFVFGILTPGGVIDAAANRKLVALAAPLPCTFHRAFDDLDDKAAALETLIECGFRRLLTSGGAGNAADHCATLRALVLQAGSRISVMPGGGVRVHNIAQLAEETGAAEYHSAATANGSTLTDAAMVAALRAAIS